MSRVIGKGRYATETYPERSGGGGGLIQVGYAQQEKSRTLPPTTNPFDTEIPSDPSGTVPLRVVFPSATPGNFLEVDVNLNVENPDIREYRDHRDLRNSSKGLIPVTYSEAKLALVKAHGADTTNVIRAAFAAGASPRCGSSKPAT
jgi:hypothetical protein